MCDYGRTATTLLALGKGWKAICTIGILLRTVTVGKV
jgi:hypothetical protein